MSGRFFSLMIFLSIGNMILISSKIKWNKPYSVLVTVLFFVIFALGFELRFPILVSQYDTARMPFDFSGAIDERYFYYSRYGLLSNERNGWPETSNVLMEEPDDYFLRCGGVGAFSVKNPNLFTVDRCALIDPFLSRIPAIQAGHWRPGHNFRKIPTNYGEYMIHKVDSVKDKTLSNLFNDINLVVRGELLTFDRFKAIWRLNSNYDYNVDWQKYKDPNLWIPISDYSHKRVIKDWKVPLILTSRSESLEVVSKTHKIVTGILIDITFEFQYDVYINEEFALTLEKEILCEEGKFITLNFPVNMNSIEFLAVNMKMPRIQGKTKVEFMQILGPNDKIPQIDSKCTFNGKIKKY